jgi:opacity protein-like surface antigen
MIRSFVGACAIAFAVVQASLAADMPAGGRYLAPDFGAAFAWGGVYVGLYGGYGWRFRVRPGR